MLSLEYCTSRLQCSNDDKRTCLKTVEKLYNMAQIARKNGLLVLEEMVENELDLFLQKSTLMIVDTIDPNRIQKVLETYIVAGNYYGKDFLEKVLVMDATLMIQQGENPKFLLKTLGAWFGMEFLAIFEEETQVFLPKDSSPSEIRIRRYGNDKPSSPSAFEKFCNLDSRSMHRVLQGFDAFDIAPALYSANESTVQHILNNMSKRMRAEVITAMNELENYQERVGMHSQAMIEDYAKALEKRGEIIFLDAMVSSNQYAKNKVLTESENS